MRDKNARHEAFPVVRPFSGLAVYAFFEDYWKPAPLQNTLGSERQSWDRKASLGNVFHVVRVRWSAKLGDRALIVASNTAQSPPLAW
jgi:hypothetical protein